MWTSHFSQSLKLNKNWSCVQMEHVNVFAFDMCDSIPRLIQVHEHMHRNVSLVKSSPSSTKIKSWERGKEHMSRCNKMNTKYEEDNTSWLRLQVTIILLWTEMSNISTNMTMHHSQSMLFYLGKKTNFNFMWPKKQNWKILFHSFKSKLSAFVYRKMIK